MSTLSIRLDAELEDRLDREVERLGTTRSRFVQDLLLQRLESPSPFALLQEARTEYKLPNPARAKVKTNKAANVKALVRAVVAGKGRAK
ncbi:ribbon-helix-helix protein, CopG family [Caenimonas koreensis]|nr:ribbon-helix-helix protein, CopG family [Caenimonas koreensis]